MMGIKKDLVELSVGVCMGVCVYVCWWGGEIVVL